MARAGFSFFPLGNGIKRKFTLNQGVRWSPTSIGELVSKTLRSFQPSREIAIRALRHLSEKKKEDLFSKKEVPKKIAIGQWYEAVIYERLLELATLDGDYTLVRKWNDIWRRNRIRSRLGQDGLVYDETGAIVVRGNGQDIAELDILLTNRENEIAFAEVKNSGNNLEEFDTLIDYKRRLLSFLFSQPIQFVLISSLELSNKPAIKLITSIPGNFFVVTGGLDKLHSSLKPEDVFRRYLRRNDGFRSMLLSDLNTTKINYLELHNMCRAELVNSVMNSRTLNFKGNFSLVKRIVVGYLTESSIESLLSEKEIIFHGERLTSESFRNFSRAVLAVSMPELRPALYLRLRAKPVYLKMGPFTTLTFKFERRIYQRRTAFFDWLENVESGIGPHVMNQILHQCLNESVAGNRRKLGESENID